MDILEEKFFEAARNEGLLAERQEKSGTVKQIEEFMKKYRYKDGRDWWVRMRDNG